MKKRRDTSDEERELFRATVADAVPLNAKPAVRKKPARKKLPPPAVTQVHRPTPKPPRGIDGRTASRLRRGQLEPQARLDLHGMTEAAAHRTLLTFLRSAHARGARLALIVTGKGSEPAPDEAFDLGLDRPRRGVLKRMTPRWLKEPELAAFVAEVAPAHRRHGGDGALYVYLRK